MTTKRNIAALPLADVVSTPVPTGRPEVTWIDPRELLVDEAYQRNLSERSMALIRRIAAGWDWRKFKAPNCAWTADGLEIIDGQHTAIGAACRSDIAEIPVLITEATEQADRAAAFIGLNRDRVGITATQLHVAAVTAGDSDAVAIEQACAAVGVTVLKSSPGHNRFKPGDTMAISAIGTLVRRYGAEAQQVLRPLAASRLAPIQASHIKAVELLLTDPEYSQVEAAEVARAIASVDDAEREAKLFAATHGVPVWRALAIVWFRKSKKTRKHGSPPLLGSRKPAPPMPAELTPIFHDPVGVYGAPQELPPAPKQPLAFLDDMKRDDRAAKAGWAPGRHIRRCSACDCRFQGAISASWCADCAYGQEAENGTA